MAIRQIADTELGKGRDSPRSPSGDLFCALADFFGSRTQPGDLVLVAFSGGPDSCALLWGLSQVAPEFGLRLHAAHFDHGLDRGSAARSRAARDQAELLQIPFSSSRAATTENELATGESPETSARRQRYAYLARLSERLEASLITTAHHSDDQAETVLLRILFGSGLEGLAAMESARGRVQRPLLGTSRSTLAAALSGSPLRPVIDPTNADLTIPRNRVRQALLPRLRTSMPDIDRQLCRLASAAGQARQRIEGVLLQRLSPRSIGTAVEIERCRLVELPSELWPQALALLHRLAGAAYPPPASARNELERQLEKDCAVGCDAGAGWRWDSDHQHLWLRRPGPAPRPFAYNLEAPGSVDLLEVGLRFHLRPASCRPWMYRQQARRVGLRVELSSGEQVEIRNRRPGDQLQVLGSSGHRRLKDLLIDRRIPRFERDLLPLLWIQGQLAWVPGVTLGEPFRLPEPDAMLGNDDSIWIAEIEPL